MVKANTYAVLLILIFGCTPIPHSLQFEQKTYLGKEFKIDGYYTYQSFHTPRLTPNKTDTTTHFLFFYKNGVTYRINFRKTNIDSLENKVFQDSSFIAQSKRVIWDWGIFKVQNDQIINNNFGFSPGLGSRIPNFIFEYQILNDTTIQSHRSNPERTITHHFKKFSPKPDSTNIFVDLYKAKPK